MEAEIYYQIHQIDGRIENHHLSVNNNDTMLDLYNQIKKADIIEIKPITENDFQFNMTKTTKVKLYEDKFEENDALGEYVGYLEHYEL